MAFDPDLAERVRDAVAERTAPAGLPVQERRMFGGLAFMVAGRMACGVVGDEVMVKIGPARYEWALQQPHVRPMDFTGRPMTGYVFITATGITDTTRLRRWIADAVDHANPGPDTPRPKRR